MEIAVELVEDALEHLWDYNRIGAHPLADVLLKPRGRHTRLSLVQRGAALNERLVAAIEQMKVRHGNPGKSRERRYYPILFGCYIEGLPNREVARTLNVSERTFYRERLRALASLRRLLVDGTGRVIG